MRHGSSGIGRFVSWEQTLVDVLILVGIVIALFALVWLIDYGWGISSRFVKSFSVWRKGSAIRRRKIRQAREERARKRWHQ